MICRTYTSRDFAVMLCGFLLFLTSILIAQHVIQVPEAAGKLAGSGAAKCACHCSKEAAE